MKQLVTGGAGFIGTNYIRYILESHPEDEILCLDKLTYAGNYENLRALEKEIRFHFVRADICDREAVDTAVQDFLPDVIVNFAAESHVDRSIENPEIFLKTNILGTGVLLDAVNRFGVQRFHQISTDEVYGDLPHEGGKSFTEDDPLKPSSPYSASKASADLLCLSYRRTYGTPVSISRCSNNFGPYQHPEKLIPMVIQRAMQNETIPVYGDGMDIRDWIYVRDHCEAVDLIIRKGAPGEVYNIGASCEKRNIEVVREILSILGKPESLIRYVDNRPGADRRYALNAEKVKRELGWKAKTDFDLHEIVQWTTERIK